jgi:diguanylate cyclase (GGDEF)-like protein
VALQGRALEPRRGGRIPIELSVAPIFDRERASAGVVVVFRDVSESRRLTERLSWQATHDALTGLVNRREFERRLELLVEQATVDENEHALLYMDLDQFKVVNDSCGHAAGDALLRLVTATLAQAVRHSDTLARLGGDEFGVLLPGCALEKATSVAEQLRRAVHELSFAWEGKTFRVAASVGVVEIGSGSASGSRLLEAADTACYSAKDKGRNRVQAFKPDDAELALRRGEMQWIARIRSALDDDRLRLYCQRIGPLSPGAPTGDYFEVLIRLLDENGNLVPPMAFIPAAERFNLMPEIDRYVIRKSFEALAGLPAAPLLAINLSGASFSETGLLDYIKAQFERHRVMPERICFEITETAAIANLEAARRLIHDLRALGCRFSLDDFGSGLSSFGYLKGLSVDQLKIDGRFVRDIAKDPIDAAMVRAIHDIGHVMGLRTVAEWVENDETIAVLRAIGVDYIQGYGVEKPKPIEEALGAARNASAGKTACASSAR